MLIFLLTAWNTAPALCLHPARAKHEVPAAVTTVGLLLSPLSVVIRPCGHLTAPFKSSGCHSNHLKWLRCWSSYSASEYMPLGPSGSLLSSGEQTQHKRIRLNKVIAKERASWLIYVNASSVCSDYYLWLDHLVLLLFNPSHFTDGKSEAAQGREVAGQMSHGKSQAEWRLSWNLQASCTVLFQLHQNSI